MRILKKVANFSFTCLLFAIFGLAQEVQAAPPISFNPNLGIDFDMKLPDGSPYKNAQVMFNIEYLEAHHPSWVGDYLQIGGLPAHDLVITSTNGNYVHNYGSYDMGNLFNYSLGGNTFRYAYYYNLRITPEKYIRNITLGDVKTVRATGYVYDSTWSNPSLLDYDHPFTLTNKFSALPNGVFKYIEENFLTGSHNRPTVEFGSIQMGQGASYAAYHLTSVDKSGKKINFVATPYEVKENYVDISGAPITPPSGFTQGNLTYANAEQFTHVVSGLPFSYTVGGNHYVYKGSYNGPSMPGTLNQSNPPSITVDYTDSSISSFDDEGQITVVYALAANLIEKYVDESGVQIDPTWDPASPLSVEDGVPFTIPHTIGDTKTDSSGDDWEYVGWKYDTDPTGTKRTTPTTNTINGDTSIEYIYKQAKTTATLNLAPNPQVVANNGNVSWTSRLENTGNATLKDLVMKATSNWAAGLSAPTQVTVTPAGGSSQNFTVSSTDWTSGFNLTGINIPSGGTNNYADITFTDTATGAVNQVLPAEIEIDGNMASPLTAENFVRIDDPDEPNLNPTGNAGLINIPDFRFGQTEVKPYAQTKGLDASSYQSGYTPYIRLLDKESTGGWTLTGKLGQFTSGSQTLATTTSITLKNGTLNEVQNYNKSNESLSPVQSAGTLTIPSDGTTIAFTSGGVQGVYQLNYAFNDVELELMAHSGIAGLSYTADMDWTLTTAP